jgi:pimeloyl-ACP methyl ester carboxylesterase
MSKIYFIHGITGSKNNFIYLQKHFPGSESFDLIGFGEAKKPDGPYDKEFFVSYLETKIREKAILTGHSMGSILAKDFALAHPELVERLFLISYPMQKDGKTLEEIILRDRYTKALIGNTRLSKFVTRWDYATRYLAVPLSYIFWHKYYLTARDYFRRTPVSLTRSVYNTILKDDYHTLNRVKDKALLIMGQNDRNADQSLLEGFNYCIIPKMRHYFFGYEDQIAAIIKQALND